MLRFCCQVSRNPFSARPRCTNGFWKQAVTMLAAAQNALRDRLHAFTDIKITLREGLTALAPQALRAHREPPGFLSTKACG